MSAERTLAESPLPHGSAARPHDHHHHGETGGTVALRRGLLLNGVFVVAELSCGVIWGSMALLADGLHNLLDVFTLILALLAAKLAARPPRGRRTYGHKRLTILVPLWSSLLLLAGTGALVLEAIHRLGAPPDLPGTVVMAVAGLGLVVNGLTARWLHAGAHGDLNLRAAFVHMMADAMVSLGALLAGAGMLYLGWAWLDPVMAIVIAAVIGFTASRVLLESFELAADVAPRGTDMEAVEATLMTWPGALSVHHLHVWALSTKEVALTAHLVLREPATSGAQQALLERLRVHFGIGHATIQTEVADEGWSCPMQSCESDAP